MSDRIIDYLQSEQGKKMIKRNRWLNRKRKLKRFGIYILKDIVVPILVSVITTIIINKII